MVGCSPRLSAMCLPCLLLLNRSQSSLCPSAWSGTLFEPQRFKPLPGTLSLCQTVLCSRLTFQHCFSAWFCGIDLVCSPPAWPVPVLVNCLLFCLIKPLPAPCLISPARAFHVLGHILCGLSFWGITYWISWTLYLIVNWNCFLIK